MLLFFNLASVNVVTTTGLVANDDMMDDDMCNQQRIGDSLDLPLAGFVGSGVAPEYLLTIAHCLTRCV